MASTGLSEEVQIGSGGQCRDELARDMSGDIEAGLASTPLGHAARNVQDELDVNVLFQFNLAM